MHESLRVQVLESLQHLACHVGNVLFTELMHFDGLVQRATLEELHHNPHLFFHLVRAQELDNVRVFARHQERNLAVIVPLVFVGHVRQFLDGHAVSGGNVFAAEYATKSALAAELEILEQLLGVLVGGLGELLC